MQLNLFDAGNLSPLNRHRLALAIKFSVIAVAVIAFYVQDLNIVFRNALGDETTYHILAIPFLFAYLLYRKRAMITSSLKQENPTTQSTLTKNLTLLIGVLLTATAILTYWFGSYTFTPIEYHMLTLPILTAGLILILFNSQALKQLAFPVAFLFFLTPPPTEILYSVGSTLQDLSAHASNAIINVFGIASTINTQYGSPIIALTRPDQTIMSFSIDITCSGVYSLIGFVIFAVFIAYITRGKLRGKLAILLLGIPLIVALNIIRITSILAIGYGYGDALALQVFHALGATVLMFIGTLILLITTEKFIKKPKPQQPCISCSPQTVEPFCPNCGKIYKHQKIKITSSDLVKVAGITLTIIILLTIQAPVFALTQGPAQILTQTPTGTQPNTQTYPLPKIPGYNLSYIYEDKNFEQVSGQEASLIYVYNATQKNQPMVWVALEIAPTIGPLHRWETCLINYPLSQGLKPRVSQLDLRDIQTQDNPPIVARYFAFQYHTTNQTQVVLYWYETATFSVNGTSVQRIIKMSLIVYPESADQVAASETLLLPYAQAINDYWQPIKAWSTVSLTISQNGLALSALTIALILALMVYQLYLNQQDKKALKILYSKLPTQTKQLYQAVENAQKENNPTTQGIADQLQKITGAPPDPVWLNERLKELQTAGLIKQTIVNKSDQPAVEWRNQLTRNKNLLGTLRKII